MTMSFIEVPSPPGVSSWITSAAACSLLARSMESLTNDADTGLISLSRVIAITSGRLAALWRPPRRRAGRKQRREAHDRDCKPASHTPNGTSRRLVVAGNSDDRDGGHLGRAVGHAGHHQPAAVIDAAGRSLRPACEVTLRPRSSSWASPVNPSRSTPRSAARWPTAGRPGAAAGRPRRRSRCAATSPAPGRRAELVGGRFAFSPTPTTSLPSRCSTSMRPQLAVTNHSTSLGQPPAQPHSHGIAHGVGDHQRQRRQQLGRSGSSSASEGVTPAQ